MITYVVLLFHLKSLAVHISDIDLRHRDAGESGQHRSESVRGSGEDYFVSVEEFPVNSKADVRVVPRVHVGLTVYQRSGVDL